jgi:hypothetical protein
MLARERRAAAALGRASDLDRHGAPLRNYE